MTAPEPLTTLKFPWTTPRNRLERLLANFVNVRSRPLDPGLQDGSHRPSQERLQTTHT
jgi:hypothetical protein